MVFLPSFPPIHFGRGSLKKLKAWLHATSSRRPLLITDQGLSKVGTVDRVKDVLEPEITLVTFTGICENPTIDCVENALRIYRKFQCDSVIGLGGGSVLDAGKALRIITHQNLSLLEYLQNPSHISYNVAPYATIPTTAGTGAEITFGGGIHAVQNGPPLGLRSEFLRPDIAFCDPELTLTLPPKLTAATGMDALIHCLEGYLSTTVNIPAEAIALDGIQRVSNFVVRATTDGSDMEARTNMLMAAVEGGMSIYMGLGPVHALSIAFGDSPLHHGTLVTVCAPSVLKRFENLPEEKLSNVVTAMGLGSAPRPALAIADRILELNKKLGLPSTVKEMDYDGAPFDELVETASSNWFNKTSPKQLSIKEYESIISELLF